MREKEHKNGKKKKQTWETTMKLQRWNIELRSCWFLESLRLWWQWHQRMWCEGFHKGLGLGLGFFTYRIFEVKRLVFFFNCSFFFFSCRPLEQPRSMKACSSNIRRQNACLKVVSTLKANTFLESCVFLQNLSMFLLHLILRCTLKKPLKTLLNTTPFGYWITMITGKLRVEKGG